MTTIYSEDLGDAGKVTVVRSRQRRPGVRYGLLNGEMQLTVDFTELSEDALLAILLDRAEMADAKEKTKVSAQRVTMLKKLKSGDDERGRARGPGRPRKTE